LPLLIGELHESSAAQLLKQLMCFSQVLGFEAFREMIITGAKERVTGLTFTLLSIKPSQRDAGTYLVQLGILHASELDR
jgi:hypothetical protein